MQAEPRSLAPVHRGGALQIWQREVRLAITATAGHPLGGAILAGLAAAVWLVLTYGVAASPLLTLAFLAQFARRSGGPASKAPTASASATLTAP